MFAFQLTPLRSRPAEDAEQVTQALAGEPPAESELRVGDLITFGPPERADQVAFWVGDGRILHATGRDGVDRVLEEDEPAALRARRRRLVRIGPASDVSAER